MELCFIPGLGTDRRIFKNLIALLEGEHTIHHLDYSLLPLANESHPSYARRLTQHLDPNKPYIFIGMSLGGTLATEAVKYFPNAKLIIISSIKSHREAPKIFNFFRWTGLYKYGSASLSRAVAGNLSRFFGVRTPEGRANYRLMLAACPDEHFAWARGAILTWRNDVYPADVLHIHGNHDHIFPFSRVKNAVLIPKGTHNMVADQAPEVAVLVNKQLAAWATSGTSQ